MDVPTPTMRCIDKNPLALRACLVAIMLGGLRVCSVLSWRWEMSLGRVLNIIKPWRRVFTQAQTHRSTRPIFQPHRRLPKRVGVERSEYYPLPFFNRLSSRTLKQPHSRLQPPPHTSTSTSAQLEKGRCERQPRRRDWCAKFSGNQPTSLWALPAVLEPHFQLPCSTPHDNKVSLKWWRMGMPSSVDSRTSADTVSQMAWETAAKANMTFEKTPLSKQELEPRPAML